MDRKILVIEDDDQDQKIIKTALRQAGFTQLIFANDGYQGIQLALQEKPDLIILDVNLPAGNGLAVIKNIKLSQLSKDIPVVIHSGTQDDTFKERLLELGACIFIKKDADSSKLIEAVNSLIQT